MDWQKSEQFSDVDHDPDHRGFFILSAVQSGNDKLEFSSIQRCTVLGGEKSSFAFQCASKLQCILNFAVVHLKYDRQRFSKTAVKISCNIIGTAMYADSNPEQERAFRTSRNAGLEIPNSSARIRSAGSASPGCNSPFWIFSIICFRTSLNVLVLSIFLNIYFPLSWYIVS